MDISVVINTYNASKHLAKTLDSVRLVEDIVVCDMYSDDDTVEIAKSYGCRVVYFEKCGICEPARNFAIQSAKHDWVLLLDADEVVSPQLFEYLKSHIATDKPAEGLFIPRKNFFHGVFMHASYPDYILRFFKKSSCDWPPIIHSVPKIDGRVEYINKKRRDLAIIHLDDQTVAQRIAKMNNYTDKEIIRLRERGRTFGYFSVFGRSFTFFKKFYFIKGGFRDGKMGLVYSVLHTFYRFLIIAKSWEKQES